RGKFLAPTDGPVVGGVAVFRALHLARLLSSRLRDGKKAICAGFIVNPKFFEISLKPLVPQSHVTSLKVRYKSPHLFSHMHAVVDIISRAIDVPFNTKAFQMSCYPPTGARYVKHRDVSPLSPTRRITLLYLYYTLSQGWTASSSSSVTRSMRFFPHTCIVSPSHYRSVAESLRRYLTTHHLKPLSERTIFVSIASYRDPETHPTILSLLTSAAHPSRVRVGILYQDDPVIDAQLHPPLPPQLLPSIRAFQFLLV
ncbi:LOW QUALITY PROTEIN: hypothetical protein BC937DRAFT_90615, partial [Endogone sp. FLAS-F59071]